MIPIDATVYGKTGRKARVIQTSENAITIRFEDGTEATIHPSSISRWDMSDGNRELDEWVQSLGLWDNPWGKSKTGKLQ